MAPANTTEPTVIFVIGANGMGITTTIGKIAGFANIHNSFLQLLLLLQFCSYFLKVVCTMSWIWLFYWELVTRLELLQWNNLLSGPFGPLYPSKNSCVSELSTFFIANTLQNECVIHNFLTHLVIQRRREEGIPCRWSVGLCDVRKTGNSTWWSSTRPADCPTTLNSPSNSSWVPHLLLHSWYSVSIALLNNFTNFCNCTVVFLLWLQQILLLGIILITFNFISFWK